MLEDTLSTTAGTQTTTVRSAVGSVVETLLVLWGSLYTVKGQR